MNGVESTILEKTDAGDMTWFPLQRCLRIDKSKNKKSKNQSEDSNELDELLKEIKSKFERTEEAI